MSLKKIQDNNSRFLDASKDPDYVCITRSNGVETFAISNQKLKYINLNDLSTLSERHSDEAEISHIEAPFQPTTLILNGKEDLLCAYTSTRIAIATIPKSVKFTKFLTINLNLKEDQFIIQCIFNNISLNCAELVVLTTTSILVYNINRSCDVPASTINFKGDDEEQNNGDNDDSDGQEDITQTEFFGFNKFSEPIVYDPVSISFGSNQSDDRLNPKGDLTLFILTADCSLYRLYPFLPDSLQVSHKWYETLFEYSSLQYKLMEKECQHDSDLLAYQKQRYAPMLKFSTLLSLEISKDIVDLKQTLPKSLLEPKITGPLIITPFDDTIYDQNCLKLLVLKNDILVIVLDGSIIISYDYNHPPMAFKDIYINEIEYFNTKEGKEEDEEDDENTLKLLDNVAIIQYSLLKGGVIDSFVTPNSSNQSIVLFSKDMELVHVDFTQWIDKLMNLSFSDLSDLMDESNSEGLPTKSTVTKLFHSFNKQIIDPSGATSVSLLNKLFINWFDTKTYATIPADNRSLKCIDLSIVDLKKVHNSIALQSVEIEETQNDSTTSSRPAECLLTSSNQELHDLINSTHKSIASINSEIVNAAGNDVLKKTLDENNVDIEILKTSKITMDKSSGALMNLIKIYGLLNNRLSLQKNELQNQINAYVDLNSIYGKFSNGSKEKIDEVFMTQNKLNERASALHQEVTEKVKSLVEKVSKSEELSDAEKKLLSEFESLESKLAEKQERLNKLTSNIKLLKQMDTSKVLDKFKSGFEDLQFELNSKVISKQLESRQVMIENLVDMLRDLKVQN